MLGGHCIKAWSKTQKTVARSSAESELYAIVKASCEGLGAMTLMKDLGSEVKVRVHVDASAAIGIIERRGISKVRHLEVDVLWLQEAQARRMLPIAKIRGTCNPADLMTKNVGTSLQNDHLTIMHLRFEAGRATKAAQLHSVRGGDSWEERCEKGKWIRKHNKWRDTLFTPLELSDGLDNAVRLSPLRVTVGVYSNGERFHRIDKWQKQVNAHKRTDQPWKGETTFTLA